VQVLPRVEHLNFSQKFIFLPLDGAVRLEKLEGQAWICLYNILSTRYHIKVLFFVVDMVKEFLLQIFFYIAKSYVAPYNKHRYK
jgi:hypothetical protein